MFHWLKQVSLFISSIFNMGKLAWQAHAFFFVSILLLTIMQGLVPLATAWLTKLLFDLLTQSLQSDSNLGWSPLLLLLIIQAILATLKQMITPLNKYLNAELGRKLTLNVQLKVYRKVNSFVGIAYFENPTFYDTIRLAEQGAQYSAHQILNTLVGLIQNAVTLFSFLGILLAFNSLLALIVGLAALPQLYAQIKLGRQRFGLTFQLSPKERRKFYYSTLLSGIQSAKEIRLFNLANYLLKKFEQTQKQTHQIERNQQLRELRWEFLLGMFSSLVASGAFVLVIIQAFSGRLTLGDISLYLNAVMSVQSALGGMVIGFSGLNECSLFYGHFTRLLELPQPLPTTKLNRTMPKLRSGIELQNVSFRYTEQHPWILRHINLFVPAGKCLALIGLNGAGKTTLVKLLTRLYDPTEGQILWDGIDIREFAPTELRQKIGTVFQDFMHYELTAQENIGFGDINQIDDLVHIHQAASKAGIQNLIQSLSKGYQTILSRTFADDSGPGVDLSGGEWQKVAIARMYMRETELLILDEPTASLDVKAEYEIYHRFTKLVSGRTSVLISHRFSTVKIADIIAVLEGGQITEYGSHNELLSLGGAYASLYKM